MIFLVLMGFESNPCKSPKNRRVGGRVSRTHFPTKSLLLWVTLPYYVCVPVRTCELIEADLIESLLVVDC